MAELTAIFPEHYPEKHGFDENYGGDQSANQGNRFLFPETKRFRNLQDLGKEGDCVTDILTDCAVDFIERKKDQPFLVYLSASSPESVGEFWFGEGSEVVIEGGFNGFVGAEAVRFSGGQFYFVVESLDNAR
jgi:hypothetical protein